MRSIQKIETSVIITKDRRSLEYNRHRGPGMWKENAGPAVDRAVRPDRVQRGRCPEGGEA